MKQQSDIILSAVILSRTDSTAIFEMTRECIRTLLESEPRTQIILVESNPNYREDGFGYPEAIEVILPNETFNFHRFLNFGIKAAKGEFIALLNNDLVFSKDWFSKILQVARQHKDISSFSPVENVGKTGFSVGYKVMTHVKGWCIVARKSVFDKIGPLDETFDFYFADNDYAMTLKSKNIRHALVFESCVKHLAKRSTPVQNSDRSFLSKYDLPDYLKDTKYDWVLNSERNLSGFLKFHAKWGNPDWLFKKNKLADYCQKYGFGFLIPSFFKIK